MQQETPDDIVESLDGYCDGGYHPVHLHDIFNNRYKVVAKLGNGANSTVWCALDIQNTQRPRHFALKVCVSATCSARPPWHEIDMHNRVSNGPWYPGKAHVSQLLEFFWHNGPNGRHLCLVFPLLVVDCVALMRAGLLRRAERLKVVSRHVVMGLSYLFRVGMVHGDLHPGNIMVEIPEVEASPVSFEEPRLLERGSPCEAYRPRYLVPAQRILCDLDGLAWSRVSFKIVDLGCAFLHLRSTLGSEHAQMRERWTLASVIVELASSKFMTGSEIMEIATGKTMAMSGSSKERMRDIDDEMMRCLSNHLRYNVLLREFDMAHLSHLTYFLLRLMCWDLHSLPPMDSLLGLRFLRP
ncbi:hypothetical protein FE257_004209 [Aspergillus nanangensis]|uniref:non-specific serine/threonine protein kinase n=1 Tax=Aspergillus nanangensis TaxID=2582783 RepID=A0AAD4CS03_ASPNN|nr:hypothetical protein FE257_004209 [Aspergillus nanangensis]